MNPLEYLHLQFRLEGKDVINGDRLRQVEVVSDEELPLMILAQLVDSPLVAYYDEALSPALRIQLAKQVADLTFPEIEPLLAVLKARTVSVDARHYKTCTFPESFQQYVDRDVVCCPGDDPHVQAYCIERAGKIVSSCVSIRENAYCAEAWVYTDDDHRRQGLAQKVVSAWAKGLLDAGKVPFYSYEIENIASANLAKRLELKPIFEEIAIAYMHV